MVDAPVSGGPHDIAAGQVTLFVGGEDDAVKRVRPLLSTYGDPILHVGRTGAGQLVKLINNTLFAAQIGLVAEGGRLGGLLGVAEPTLLEALTHGSAASRALGNIGRAGSTSAFIDCRRRLHRQRRRGGPRDGRRTGRRSRPRSTTSSSRRFTR